jgi:serine/threonine-protein kinase HipA
MNGRCPSCLKPGKDIFCLPCRKVLFDGRKVSEVLPFGRPEFLERHREGVQRISISGVQPKHSLRLGDAGLELCESDGRFLLKPSVPGSFQRMDQMPANEHATMRIAAEVFGMPVAPCAVLRFPDDGSTAYLTRRFDVQSDGTRLAMEDFAQIIGVSEETGGPAYKYAGSYEGIADHLRLYASAYRVEAEVFFQLVVFNYLVHNGDAHLKNFSLLRDPAIGFHRMAPAYDLLNTRLHLPNDSAMALDLFTDDTETESFAANGFLARDDFELFAERLGIAAGRAGRILGEFGASGERIDAVLERSFLSEESKAVYRKHVADRINALRHSHRTRG